MAAFYFWYCFGPYGVSPLTSRQGAWDVAATLRPLAPWSDH